MMTRKMLVAALALLPLGCSFYYSSESSVKTLTSPSRSSASSSPDDDGDDEQEKKAYRDDVRDFTVAYATEHDGVEGFADGLADVARRHGITDWEANAATFTAVGSGLKRAEARPADVARYERAVGGNDPAKAELIRRGYES